jgi:predicted RND superfamily exporter protein
MLAAFIAFYDRWILRRPELSLGFTLLVVVALSSQLGNLKLDASADSLVLEGDSALEYFRESSARYDSEEFLLVTYQPFLDLLTDESLDTLKQLRDELAQVPGVSSTTTILDVPLLQSPPVPLSAISSEEGLPTLSDPGIDRCLVREEFRVSPIYAQLLVSPSGRTTAVQINLQRDQHYIDLLERREHLRALRDFGSLTPAQEDELPLVEKEFKSYSSVVNERQALLVETV